MSNLPPPLPQDPSQAFDYFPPEQDGAAKLVRLAVIFNYISAGVDFLGLLVFVALGALFLAQPNLLGQQPQPGDRRRS
jgi:hypothetical protein